MPTDTLHIQDLWGESLRYEVRGTSILSDANIAISAGRVTGLLGPNGSGKSTLMHLIIGALSPSGGELWIGEPQENLLTVSRLERARILAMVEQNALAHDDLAVADVIALGRLPHQGRFGGAPESEIIFSVAAQMSILDLLNRDFRTLSGGERQRVHLARALAQTPRVLLLDEPTNHLDISAQLDLARLVKKVAADGAGVLMALHDLTLAARMCDDVAVIHDGVIVATGAPQEVLTPDLIHAVWGVDGEWVYGQTGAALVFS